MYKFWDKLKDFKLSANEQNEIHKEIYNQEMYKITQANFLMTEYSEKLENEHTNNNKKQRYTAVSQKFCNILVTYLLSSSCNKSSRRFKVDAIVLHSLKPPFWEFFDRMLMPLLVFQGEVFLRWSFSLL